MTRISEMQLARGLLNHVQTNRSTVNKYSNEVSSGVKVAEPGDSSVAGVIAQQRDILQRIEGYSQRAATAIGYLEYQEALLDDASQVLARAKEVAEQGANETLGATERAQLAAEVWQLRDQLVTLANSKYQGRYVYGGSDDDDPPYDPATYTNPATGSASQRYVFDAESGTDVMRTINITEDLTVDITSQGDSIFDNGIQALERLGRALEGYDTLPANGAPDGTGNAYVFPGDYSNQTAAIRGALSQLDTARQSDIMPERTTVGAKLRRIETARAVLESTKTSTQQVLSKLQDADSVESISRLTQAQAALEASLAVTARILNQSILNYI